MMVNGDNIPNPILSFEESTLDEDYLKEIKKMGIDEPTAIQKQGIPMALAGRDMVGVSKTGSGKTLAFMLPAIVHCKSQPRMKHGDGPICLVLAPTRELAVQIQKM
jgi:ATP-dependent RNA helicase DDX5/DBP2